MKDILKNASTWIGSINEAVGRSVAWLTTLLVVIICVDVALRYIFSNTKAWILELEWHLFALIFLLGAGYAFKHDRHVRVDLFYANFSKRDKAWINLIGGIIFPHSLVSINHICLLCLCLRILADWRRLSRPRWLSR